MKYNNSTYADVRNTGLQINKAGGVKEFTSLVKNHANVSTKSTFVKSN